MESEFPSNSQMPPRQEAKQTPEKDVQKVISGKAVERKKPLGRRFLETFGATDTKTVVKSVYTDFLIPQSKRMFFELFMMGMELKLFGEARGSYRPGATIGQQMAYTAYNRMSTPNVVPGSVVRPDPRSPGNPGYLSPQSRQMHDFRDIVIPSRAEASAVLDQLYMLLQQFEVVSVGDYYKTCGITPEFTDERWGWYSLQGSDIAHVHEGWLVNLPAPEPIV